jgi:hypothetical protein
VKYAIVGLMLCLTAAKASAEERYADWTVISGTNGTGTFNGVAEMPDFTFIITGNPDPASTLVDDDDVFDNSTWEANFGEGDNQESLRFGKTASPNLTISILTITFSSPVNPSGIWAFAVTDLEGEDAVIGASLAGNPIADAVVASWFQELFDSNPATQGLDLPSGFDADNVAVVAEFDPDGLLSDEILFNFIPVAVQNGGTESASAWFVPNTPIDTLTITHRNRYGGAASMHVYIAATDTPISVGTAVSPKRKLATTWAKIKQGR